MPTAFVTTLLTILVVELTDKTRLIAMLLSARFRAPFALMSGMTLGYVPAIAVAVFGAEWLTRAVPPNVFRWVVAVSFLAFGALLLWEKEGEEKGGRKEAWLKKLERYSPFWVGFALVALTEFGDKSQLATAALELRFQRPCPVFLGSLTAQAILNVIYVLFGHALGERLPAALVSRIAGIAFLLAGLVVLLR